ncbi:MAG: glutathione S-transferase family protein [Gammaproteobacteria bacterium]|nr:glutathione S-transferase family protein [Gammaproteobacteria bacterium]
MKHTQASDGIPLKFYCAWYCPFAQRAWMALLHKGLDFEYIEVDPYRESQWWLEISRGRAMVPVIVSPPDGDAGPTTVIDSTRILEYLEDLVPDCNPLYPDDANTRAELRFWIDHVNERIVPHMYRFLRAEQPGDSRNASRQALLEGLRAFGEALSPSGPFFAGTELTAVDLALAPFAYRIDTLLGHYRAFAVPSSGDGWPRYQRWFRSMCDTAIFKATLSDPDSYRQRLIEHYLPYSQGREQ